MSPTGSCSVLSALDAALATDVYTTDDAGGATEGTTKGTTEGAEGTTEGAEGTTDSATEGTTKDTIPRMITCMYIWAKYCYHTTQFFCRERNGHILSSQLSTK